MQRRFLGLAVAAIMTCGTAPAIGAYDNPEMLTIEKATGDIAQTFTIEQLKTEFQPHTYDTRTPWSKDDETIVFRGPLMKDVLAKVGIADNPAIKVIAYDNFVSEIRMDEIQSFEPILAVERKCTADDISQGSCKEGQEFRPISMLEKGPIFVVWPFDRLPSAYVPARNSIWVFFPVALRPIQ